MADVTVTINGHDYVVACKDGEEKHLHFLADYVTKKVSSLVVSFGQIGEARLLLMAALFVADELSEAFSQLGDLKTEVADLKNKVQKAGSGSAKPVAEDAALAALLGDAARRIEDLATRIERS
jgi:cell division protein ZapA